jgi:SAM-dependent methyltransferase
MIIDETTSKKLLETWARILEAENPAYDPWLERHQECATQPGATTYIRHREDMLALARLTDLTDLEILEAGCGFGFGLIYYAARGAKAYGLELYEPMVRTIEAYMPLVPDEWAERIQVSLGDATDMPYPDESVDVVVSNEAISHYHDVDAFIREAHRVLRPGGTLIVADGNNSLNPLIRHRNYTWFREVEEEGGGDAIFQQSFREKRLALVSREFDFDAATAAEIASGTSGMTRDQVLAAGKTFTETGALPTSYFKRDTVPVDPESGQAIERLLNPYALARALRSAGFTSTRTVGYWGGAAGKSIVRLGNRVLTPLSPIAIFSAQSFRIVARR